MAQENAEAQGRAAVRPWRERSGTAQDPGDAAPPAAAAAPIAAAPRHVCWLLRRPPERLRTEDQSYLTRLYHACPQIAVADALVEEFATVLREHDVPGWYAWLRGLRLSGIAEFQRFARGMWLDRAAVEAAVTLDWSNGHVEGRVHRLKTIKRSMDGCANFDLLKRRVLQPA